jgi:putative transcriptional regulator
VGLDKMSLYTEMTGASEALLAQYAAGQLRAPAHALVAAHLEMKPANRAFVTALEAVLATDIDIADPAPLQDRDARLNAIFGSSEFGASGDMVGQSGIPLALQRYCGTDITTVPWKSVLPGFKEWEIAAEDGCEIHMFWIKEGRKMPTHTHGGTELFLVLEGSFTDASGTYNAGDISIADENVNHRPVAGKDRPCIGFSVTDAPLKLTGSLAERLGMFIGR